MVVDPTQEGAWSGLRNEHDKDLNARRTAVVGVTAGGDPVYALIDADGHLQVDVLNGGGGGGQQYTEGGSTPDPKVGTIAMGEDSGGAAQPLQVDGSNSLQINIASSDIALGGGTQYTEGDPADATLTGTIAMAEEVSTNLQKPLLVDGNQHLQVDIAADSLGLATAANQLPDGHAVTVDNGAGGAAVNIQDGGNSITVDGSVSADTELPTAAALADTTANPTAPAVGAHGLVFNGTTWDRARGDATNGTLVNLGANNDVTVTGSVTANAGTNLNTSLLATEATLGTLNTKVTACNTGAIAGTVTAEQSTAASLKNEPNGSAADGATDTGNPIKVGGVADEDYTIAPQNAHPGSAITTARRGHLVMGTRRELPTSVIYRKYDLNTTLQQVYDGTPSTANVSGLETWPYREFQLSFSITLTGAPAGTFRVEVFTSADNTNYSKYMNDGMATLVFSDATISTTITRSVHFRCRAGYMKIVVTAAGTLGVSDNYELDWIDLEAST